MNTIQTTNAQSDNCLRIDVPLPEYVPVTPELETKVRPYVAVGLYLSKTLSLRAAAKVAGLDAADFEMFLGANEIPISLLTYDEVMSDVAKIGERRRAAQTEAVL